MKLNMWALVAVATVVATPALAAGDGDKSNPAVWIALGATCLGLFTTMVSVLAANKVKKKKPSDGERSY